MGVVLETRPTYPRGGLNLGTLILYLHGHSKGIHFRKYLNHVHLTHIQKFLISTNPDSGKISYIILEKTIRFCTSNHILMR